MSIAREETTALEVHLSKAALTTSLEPVPVGFFTERRRGKGAFVFARLSLDRRDE